MPPAKAICVSRTRRRSTTSGGRSRSFATRCRAITPKHAAYSDRLATPDDARFIIALHAAPHARAYVSAPPEDQLRAAAARADHEGRIVLDADGTPVGFWSLIAHDGWLVELLRIVAIAPRRGIGAWALRRMIERAFDDLGAHRVSLEVTADNAAARALYERAGFVLEGTWREGYRDAASGTYKDLCAYGMLARERP